MCGNQTLFIRSTFTLCKLWFILSKGLPPILNKLSQFVLDLFFQQILAAYFICIILHTRARWIRIQQTLSLGNLQLNREYQNVHLIITQNKKCGRVSDKVYRSWEKGEAMWRWVKIDVVCTVGIQVDSWRRGNVGHRYVNLILAIIPFLRMKSMQKEEGHFFASHGSDYCYRRPTASLYWS